MPSRNRIIYQSQALYIAPSSSGYHLQSGAKTLTDSPVVSQDSHGNTYWTGIANRPLDVTADTVSGSWYRSLLEPVERVQSANFNFTINRQDINEFGQLARLDSIVMESPTVGLDFNYYLTDGGNERKFGFNVPTTSVANRAAAAYSSGDGCISGYSALSGVLNDPQGNNFFITVVPDGEDVQGTTNIGGITDYDVIAIGNGFISDYTVEAAVGSIPTASVTVEAFNIKVDDQLSGSSVQTANRHDAGVPGVDLDGNSGTNHYAFQSPMNTTGSSDISALRPGDLEFRMQNSGEYIGLTDMAGDGSAHIQSFTLNVPLSRTILQRLGSTFGYARVVDLPVDINVSISAVVSEFQKKDLFVQLCSSQTFDFDLIMRDSACTTAGNTKLAYTIKNARLESETYTNAIGDNESVDMTFTSQIGGANDQNNGVFMTGSYPLFRVLPFYPQGARKAIDGAYSGPTTATNPY